jgi:hypothetical protein
MPKVLTFLICFACLACSGAHAVAMRAAPTSARLSASDFVSAGAYQAMYPAMTNQMRTNLNPGTTPDFSPNSVSTLTRTSGNDSRRVVARSAAAAPTAARSGAQVAVAGAARAGATSAYAASARRVVSRANPSQPSASARATSSRDDKSYIYNAIQTAESDTKLLPADRCLADYSACMNGYCQRKDTAYDRCYCSARLAQIDAEYRPAIDGLIKRILELTGTNKWSASEMNDYWNDIIGVHTGDNSWVNLENALDINWADMESRARGQQAFATGHEYCVQHLRGCYYMSNNLRDAYRSDIARDCAVYENSLRRIKDVAESFIEAYKE